MKRPFLIAATLLIATACSEPLYYGKKKMGTNEKLTCYSSDLFNYAATIMKAAFDYSNNGICKKPQTNKYYCIGMHNYIHKNNKNIPVTKTTEYGAHYIEEGKQKVYVQPIYGKTMEIYATTIYGMAYSTLHNLTSVYENSSPNIVYESYLSCVAYSLASARYGYRYDPEAFRKNYRLHNSGFFIDMIDGINDFHQDHVSGYTLEQIEDLFSKKSIGVLNHVTTEMPKLYTNSTSDGLAELERHWLRWANGEFSK